MTNKISSYQIETAGPSPQVSPSGNDDSKAKKLPLLVIPHIVDFFSLSFASYISMMTSLESHLKLQAEEIKNNADQQNELNKIISEYDLPVSPGDASTAESNHIQTLIQQITNVISNFQGDLNTTSQVGQSKMTDASTTVNLTQQLMTQLAAIVDAQKAVLTELSNLAKSSR